MKGWKREDDKSFLQECFTKKENINTQNSNTAQRKDPFWNS